MSLGQNKIDEAFMREARVGLMVLSALLAIFLYVAFGRLSGWNKAAPVAFQNQDKSPSYVDDREKTGLRPESPVGITGRESGGMGPVTQEAPSTQYPDSPLDSDKGPERGSFQPMPATDTRRDEMNRPDHASHQLQHSFVDTQDIGDSPENRLRPLATDARTTDAKVSERNTEFQIPLPPNRGQVDRVSTLIDDRSVPVRPVAATGPFRAPVPLQSFIPSPEMKQDGDVAQTNRLIAQNENPLAIESRQNRVTSDNELRDDLPDSTMSIRKDSFWLISQRVYGDGRFFDALYKVNKDRVASFNEIPEGIEILTPAASELRRKFPRLCPREEIVTLEGDTLFGIAAERMGQASRYVDLLKLNYMRLPEDARHDTPLPADIVLELPR